LKHTEPLPPLRRAGRGAADDPATRALADGFRGLARRFWDAGFSLDVRDVLWTSLAI
jgi:hypothetical protein